jgi:outer membrane immunogenic protein
MILFTYFLLSGDCLMIRSVLLAAASSLILGSVAIAADLPTTKGPPVYTPPPPPVFSWTGFYIGGQVGYEWGYTVADPSALRGVGNILAIVPGPYSHDADGIVGGLHLGYDYQISQFVIGVEGDVNGSSYEGSRTIFGPIVGSERTPIDGSIRGRAGIAFDRILVYATGGAAFGDFQTTIFDPGVFSESVYPLRVGWTVGGGLEYAIDNNWSVRAEYRYTDYGSFNVVYPTPLAYTVHYHPTDNRVQVGFSYLFNPPPPPAPPVVAKY